MGPLRGPRCPGVALTHWVNEAVPEVPSWGRQAEAPGAGVLGGGDQCPRARPRQGALRGPDPRPPGCRAQGKPDLLTPPGMCSPWGAECGQGAPVPALAPAWTLRPQTPGVDRAPSGPLCPALPAAQLLFTKLPWPLQVPNWPSRWKLKSSF